MIGGMDKFEVIFVDVDYTLVWTAPWETFCYRHSNVRLSRLLKMSAEEMQEKTCGPTDRVVTSHNNRYISRLRPGAEELLKGLREFGLPVYILSFGMTYFVKAVMQAHGLDRHVDGMFGRCNFDEVPRVGKKGLLIDDCGVEKPWTVEKLIAMGAINGDGSGAEAAEKAQIIRVPEFEGDLADTALKDVLEKVRSALG